MLTDLCFNLVLLLMSDYVFVLGASNVGYIIFNFLNLNAGWLHRIDRPNQARPWRAPNVVLAAGALLSFVNLTFMGFGADVYGSGTLETGLVFASLIVPVFLFRHYIQDKGRSLRRCWRTWIWAPTKSSQARRVSSLCGPGIGSAGCVRCASAGGVLTSETEAMLITGIKSKPVYAPLQPDLGGRYH